jgi:MinD superfamily P-loop ATPase
MIKQLVVVSGKGGTGKTTVVAALVPFVAREVAVVLADADVDASNLELLLAPTVREKHPFRGGQVAVIYPEQCQHCGTCQNVCRFEAVECPAGTDPSHAYRIDATACEGCAACMYACPTGSIRMEPVQAGSWFRSDTRFGPLCHARLFAGRENSGKLVTVVRQAARETAAERGASLVMIDGPPGIGCPVISAIAGADLALVVTEPTVSGEHDLERMLGVAEHFGIASVVLINKADLNPGRARAIESFCRDRGVAVLGRVPYDSRVVESTVRGLPLTELHDGSLTETMSKVWDRLRELLLEPGTLKVVGGLRG